MFRTEGYNRLWSLTRRPRQRCKFFIPAVKGKSFVCIHKIKDMWALSQRALCLKSGCQQGRKRGVELSREISVLKIY